MRSGRQAQTPINLTDKYDTTIKISKLIKNRDINPIKTPQTSMLTSLLNKKQATPTHLIERSNINTSNGYFYRFEYEQSYKNLRPKTEENGTQRNTVKP